MGRAGRRGAVRATVQAELPRAADEVLAVVGDPEQDPAWRPEVRMCRWATEGARDVGDAFCRLAAPLGTAELTTFRVVERRPDGLVAAAAAPLAVREAREVVPAGPGRSRVTLALEVQAPLAVRLAHPRLPARLEHVLAQDLAGLRALLVPATAAEPGTAPVRAGSPSAPPALEGSAAWG